MNRKPLLFCCMLGLAVLAACGGGSSVPLVPSSGYAAAMDAETAGAQAHAPCTIGNGLKSPVSGTPKIAIAFGQLMLDSQNSRFANPGIAWVVKPGKDIHAATSGKATYDAKQSTIVVKSSTGVETLYAGFGRPVRKLLHSSLKVKAGQTIAVSGSLYFRFQYAPSGNVLQAGTQANPCGSGASNGASGTISVMPQSIPVYVRFHALTFDGVPIAPGPYPSGNPDVATPQTLTAANVTATNTIVPTVYEHSDVFNGYYVVLCGNVVFATGKNWRAAGPFPYPSPTSGSSAPLVTPSLPPLVFFRDPGAQGKSLAAPLPAPWSQGCPAPAPATLYVFSNPVFHWIGQTKYMYYTANGGQSGDNVYFSSSSANVVSVNPASPSPLPVFATAPPAWPPPSPRADIAATGVGTATITVNDASCTCTDPPIDVTVSPTPSPAPVPSPLPNT
jgi:hypothetical protein